MKTVLVTGGSGFIGSHLCEKLLQLNYKVINLDNLEGSYNSPAESPAALKVQEHPNYTFVNGDVRDQAVLNNIFKNAKIDIIAHLASPSATGKPFRKSFELIDVDIKGTTSLLHFAKKCEAEKFIYASSSSVYGISPSPLKEDDRLKLQLSQYAVIKRCGELICETYSNLYNIPVICLRLFTVYGPGQKSSMAVGRFIREIDEGKEILIYGDGKSSRDYIYIDDTVEAIVKAIPVDCGFEIFNIGSSIPVQINQLINLLEDKLGKVAYKRYISGRKPVLKDTYADMAKVQSILGFTPETGIKAGIEELIQWYRSRPLQCSEKKPK